MLLYKKLLLMTFGTTYVIPLKQKFPLQIDTIISVSLNKHRKYYCECFVTNTMESDNPLEHNAVVTSTCHGRSHATSVACFKLQPLT